MKKLISLLSIFLVSIFAGITFGAILDIHPLIVAGASFVCSFIPMPAGSLFNLVFTTPAPAGVSAFNLPYIPQFIIYDHAAAPLTNLRVEDAKYGVIFDLPLAGIAQVGMFMRFSEAVTTVRRFRLANGEIKNRNITVTITKPGAVAIPFQACSDQPGNCTFKYSTAALLAGQPMPFSDFTALFMPGLAPGDTVYVEFKNGHSQLFNEVELLELTSLFQCSQIATGFILNNINAYIHKAVVTQAIAGAAYVMKLNIPEA